MRRLSNITVSSLAVAALLGAGILGFGCAASDGSEHSVPSPGPGPGPDAGADARSGDAGDAGAPDGGGDQDGGDVDGGDDQRDFGPIPLCDTGSDDKLCAVLPHDVLLLPFPAYATLAGEQQRPFDVFGWQAFVALNHPAKGGSITNDVTSPRVWEGYETMRQVFGESADVHACDKVGDPNDPILDATILQASEDALVDRNLNYALYDTRMNPVEVDYIRKNGLDTRNGQQAFANKKLSISFPLGEYADEDTKTGGAIPAMEIKATWRILGPNDDASRFYTVKRRILVPSKMSATHADACYAETLGLVGFHIMAKAKTGNQPQDWVWPTFEHVDNQPLADDATSPEVDKIAVCTAPENAKGTFSFFDSKCSAADCPVNKEPAGDPIWGTSYPYAKASAPTGHGSQVVRCFGEYKETEEVNRKFQKALAGTPFANYRLINTQWEAHKDPPPDTASVPRKLSNPIAESFIQNSSCIDCHRGASAAVKTLDADFSYLLRHAK